MFNINTKLFHRVPVLNPEGDPVPKGDPPTPKTFTKEQVDDLLKKQSEEHKKTTQSYLDQLNQIKDKGGLNEEEREALNAKIKELSDTSLTEKQKFEQEVKKLTTGHEKLHKDLETDRDTWKGLFSEERTVNEITREVLTADGVKPQQFLDILMPKAKIAPVLDDKGKTTKEWKVVVPWKIPSEDKTKMVTAELSIKEVITAMKTNVEEYGNLFKSGVTGGTGFIPTPGQEITNAELAKMDPEQYRKNRKHLK